MNILIFGGTGFVGVHLANFFLKQDVENTIYLIDILEIEEKHRALSNLVNNTENRIIFVRADVRKKIVVSSLPKQVDLIINLAAIHREPGHKEDEYYQTNIAGAQNVCNFADEVGCSHIVFSSSISPYGISEEIRDEQSIPIPSTPYGGSKLVAEKIHEIWHSKSQENRKLIIIRPGVIFGAGEGGNVSRLIKSVKNGYFIFLGNQNTRKAGIYIQELCLAVCWALDKQKLKELSSFCLFNLSMNPGPSLSEYVTTITDVLKVKRFFLSVPYFMVLIAAYCIDFILKPLRIGHPFSPVRIRKLVRSNDIRPKFLEENGYEFKYDLKSSFIDWKKSYPDEW